MKKFWVQLVGDHKDLYSATILGELTEIGVVEARTMMHKSMGRAQIRKPDPDDDIFYLYTIVETSARGDITNERENMRAVYLHGIQSYNNE